MSDIKYKRVVMKLSGEALAGDAGQGINPPEIRKVAEEIKEVHDLGVQIAIVVGGGNMWRGESGSSRLYRNAWDSDECFGTTRQFRIDRSTN